jgi:dipeptidyl aminopeptidase/acylaminoacyl peptidase
MIRSRFAVASAVLLLCSIAALDGQTPGRPLAIEHYYRVLTVTNPQISPDGKSVRFSVTTRVESDNSTKTETFTVPADGSAAPVKVTSGASDAQPAAGGRGGRGGGTRVTSPNGKWIARTQEKPQPKEEPKYASDFEKRHQERFKGVTFDWKDFQRDGAPFPAPNPAAQPALHVVLQPAAGEGPARTLVDTDMRPGNVTWHPDGQLLAFTADADFRNELKYDRADLWTVTTDGKVTRLTNDGAVHSDVDFSPDGTHLSYVRGFGTDMIISQKLNHGGPRDLYIRRVDGAGAPINLTAAWDLEPTNARWSPDSRFIYFTAEIGGEVHLFRIAVPGSPPTPRSGYGEASPKPASNGTRADAGKVEQVTNGARRLGNLTFDKAFTTMAYTVGVHDAPADLYAANIDGSNERRLTDVNKALASEVTLSKGERLQWNSKDGTLIEGWLLRPANYDASKGPYPLIVVSHGGPHAATGYSFDFKKQFFAAKGYFVLDTNFRSSTGYGDAFKWATWGEWGKKDGEDVVSGIDYAIKRYPIDPKRVGHTGHSYGGFMTNWLITQYPDRFAAAVTGAGISNWVSDYGTADIYRTKETEFFGTPWDKDARERMMRQSPLSYAGNVKTPTLFVHGEVDQRVPYEEAEQMYFALKRRGVPAKMIQYAGQPHGISGHWNNVHRMLNELAWWNTYLKAGPRATTSSAVAR